MANINSNPSARANRGYNGFDMSKFHKFSSSVGQILPVYYDLLNPGDKVNLSTELKTRMMPLDSGAFMSITENIDWFFVPMTQLLSWFDNMYYGIQDFKTDFVNVNGGNITGSPVNSAKYPNFSLYSLVDVLTPYSVLSNEDLADSLRLLDSLGYPLLEISNYLGYPEQVTNFVFNPILLQAYQKIYYDYYRLSDREANAPDAYNFDSVISLANSTIPSRRLYKLLKLHYIPWRKDFYTNNFISPIFGPDNISSYPLGSASDNLYDYGAVNQWLTSNYGFSLIDVTSSTQYPDTNSGNDTTVGMSNAQLDNSNPNKAQFNVANIRTMFAVDKLLEVTRRAGKHYDKQTLAHFGVKVPKGIAGEVFFINHSENKIDIGDVISTAETEQMNLGAIGGKGFGYGQNNCEYTAPCHGVLMAVYYARPEVDYLPAGVDKLHTLVNSEDFFKPEFDDLGMQPLFGYQSSFYGSSEDQNDNSRVLGWQYRYMELKQKYNSVNGALAYSGLNIWTPAKVPVNNLSLDEYLVNPNYLNSVMSLEYDSFYTNNLSDVFNTDPMIHQIRFDVRKASKMSTFGLPSL